MIKKLVNLFLIIFALLPFVLYFLPRINIDVTAPGTLLSDTVTLSDFSDYMLLWSFDILSDGISGALNYMLPHDPSVIALISSYLSYLIVLLFACLLYSVFTLLFEVVEFCSDKVSGRKIK